MAHEIYTGVHGKDGQICCGGDDCAATIFRERGDRYEFLSREGHWIFVPVDRITFLPIPGDPPSPDGHRAHLCYRNPGRYDAPESLVGGDGQTIHLYCAFIPPAGM